MSNDTAELLEVAFCGKPVTKDLALGIYGNPNNWHKIYDEEGAHWVWNGPVICPYELADWVQR